MKTIALSATYQCKNTGRFSAIVDDEDFEYLSLFSWNAAIRREQERNMYVRARRTERSTGRTLIINMHYEVWRRAGKKVPVGMTIDHIEPGEFGALDNRRSNLRIASKKDQQGNRRNALNNLSGLKGVTQHKNRWSAHLRIKGSTKYLGIFKASYDAAKAYDTAAVAYFGKFARLNFPNGRT